MALEIAQTLSTSTGAAKPASVDQPRAKSGFARRRVGPRDRLFFTEQLSMLLDSGLPTHNALLLVARQTRNPALAKAVRDIGDAIEAGQTLSDGMAAHPTVFSPSYVRLIRASEGGGYLSRVLTQLQHTDERLENLRRTLVAAFTYPVILLVFSIAVVLFVLAYVFPKFSKLFVSLGDELPWTTQVLMSVSNGLVNYWYLIVSVGIGAALLLRIWLRGESAKRVFDRMKLTVPGLRTICQQLYMSQTMQVMGLSLSNGVTVPETMRSCRDATNNRLLQQDFAQVESKLQEGGRISEAFAEMAIVPDLAKEMIATADEAGNLGQVATRIAAFYEDELERVLAQFAKIVEPVMLLVMGLVVGVLVSSLLLPVFKLSQVVR